MLFSGFSGNRKSEPYIGPLAVSESLARDRYGCVKRLFSGFSGNRKLEVQRLYPVISVTLAKPLRQFPSKDRSRTKK